MKFREAKKILNPDNNIKIGYIQKPHGYKGHLKVNFLFDPIDFSEESVLVDIHGWLIPFFIDYDQTNLNALKPIVKFEEINTEEEAKKLAGKHIFIPIEIAKKYVNLNSLMFMENYAIEIKGYQTQGKILEYIDIEKNPLIKVFFDKKEIFIPVKATEIIKINHKKKYVQIALPQGIIENL